MTTQMQRPPAGGPGMLGGDSGINSTTARRLAPYARHVIQRQRAGVEPNVYLFAGSDCWNQAEHRRRTHGDGTALVLPPGEPPESYRWPSLDALCLIPGAAEGDLVRRLVICLLCAGCRCVVEIRPDQAPACHYARADDAMEAA